MGKGDTLPHKLVSAFDPGVLVDDKQFGMRLEKSKKKNRYQRYLDVLQKSFNKSRITSDKPQTAVSSPL